MYVGYAHIICKTMYTHRYIYICICLKKIDYIQIDRYR